VRSSSTRTAPTSASAISLGGPPLCATEAAGYADLCAVLLERGAEINRHLAACRLLLERAAAIERDGAGCPSAFAATMPCGHLDDCGLLLEWSAEVNGANG
jgi:hypothetical protein